MNDDTLRVVSIADEALDTASMGPKWSDYVRTRDPKMVREVPGAKLTWFHVRRIPTRVFQTFVQTASSESMKYMRAFQCAVSQIENYENAEGQTRTVIPEHSAHVAGSNLMVWGDETMDTFPPSWVEEVGSIAYTRSFLGRRKLVTYQPPPTLAHVLAARASLDVAALLASAHQSSGSQSSPTPPRTGNGSPSGADTDATATADPTSESGNPIAEPPPPSTTSSA